MGSRLSAPVRGLADALPDLLLGGGAGGGAPEMPGDTVAGRRAGTRRRLRRAAVAVPGGVPTQVIEPRQPGVIARIREFWLYRRLTGYFGREQLEKLYQRTWLGWLWIPLRPVISVGSRVLVFGGLLGAPSGGVPYLLFFLVGLTAWQLFGYTLFWATRSIDLARRVLNKMYVPRLTCLMGCMVPSGVNFLLYAAITVIVVVCYLTIEGTTYLVLDLNTLLVPAGLLLGIALGLAIGLWTSVLNAMARDVRFVVGYVLGFWFFLTPIIYPLSRVPPSFETVVSLNPMTAPIEMVRLGLLGSGEITTTALVSCLGSIVVVGIPGLIFFTRSEARALDSL